MSRPTCLFANAAVPPERLTASPSIAPESERLATVADVVPSLTLSLAVNEPVMGFGVMSSFA